MDRMIAFLRDVPIFKHLTRMRLAKLAHYHLKKVKYCRGHYVYKKGEPSQSVYIVLSGEFQQTYEIIVKPSKKIETDNYLKK